MTLTLRYMQTDDIKYITTIDRLSFDPPWPANSYAFEINQSTVSHMVVLERSTVQTTAPSQTDHGLRRFLNTLRGRDPNKQHTGIVVGYGGLWKISEEAHVSTIAIHPDYRGHSYGEILLAGMYGKSIALGADYIVLEVRVSNRVAQNLYRKYGFTEHDIKENYYRSDKEDAYDMRVVFDDELLQQYRHLYAALQDKQPFKDQYSNCPHPRRG